MPRYRKDKVFEVGGWWLERVANSPFWYAFAYDADGGRVRRESLGIIDLEEAKIALSKKALLEAPKTPDSYLSVVLESYFAEVLDAKPSGEQGRIAGALILEFWGDTALVSDVTSKRQEAFAKWSHERGQSVSYIARNLGVLSAALRHTLGELAPRVRSWAATIAQRLNLPDPEPRDWIPTDEQLATFLDSLRGPQAEHVFRYCLLALHTVARPSAILQLKPEYIDRQHGLIDMNPPGRRQTKKRRPLLRLPATLEPWLDHWSVPEGHYLITHHGRPVASVRNTFERRGLELGMPELIPYSLRHKMATELAARGIPERQLAYQIAHDVLDQRKSTARYIKFDKRHLGEAKRLIEEYMAHLNGLTKRDLLRPDTPKILPKSSELAESAEAVDYHNRSNNSRLGVVGATGIEPVTPTMSR